MSRGKYNKTFKSTILNYIIKNARLYVLFFCVFAVGMLIGVIFINNSGEVQKEEIDSYINTYIENSKKDVNRIELLKEELKENILLVFILWFSGTTIIGIPIILLAVVFRGFCLGYTISSLIYTLGTLRGIGFILASIFLQNIIFIPVIISLAVSGIKFYKSIKDQKLSNIKQEILRHTLFSFLMLLLLIVSALIETQISFYLVTKF